MFEIIDKVHSKIDNVTKYIIEDCVFGKNEVSVIRKSTKDVIVLPTQTNCKMGCTFCHLTGTNRPAKMLISLWFFDVVKYISELESLGSRPLLISFMGAGEPLLHVSPILNGIQLIHWEFKNVRFAIATIMPNYTEIFKLQEFATQNKHISIKVHLSVHGILNRTSIIKNGIDIQESIKLLQQYHTLTQNHIEYHYTLVRDVNDSISELTEFKNLVAQENDSGVTVKFLTLSETETCKQSLLTKDQIEELFEGIIVEFYDPPGRDVGSSCGMFNRTIYMKDEICNG